MPPRKAPSRSRQFRGNWRRDTRLPVQTWRELMSIYYPNSVWLNLHRDAFERLYRYKMDHGIPTWEQALERHARQRMKRWCDREF